MGVAQRMRTSWRSMATTVFRAAVAVLLLHVICCSADAPQTIARPLDRALDADLTEAAEISAEGSQENQGACKTWCKWKVQKEGFKWEKICTWTSHCAGCTECTQQCAGHCKGNCKISKDEFDQNCALTSRMATCLGNYVEFTGDSSHPTWNVLEGDHKGKCYTTKLSATPGRKGYVPGLKIRGKVSCPCRENGKAVEPSTAQERILGQVTALGMPKWTMLKCLGVRHWTGKFRPGDPKSLKLTADSKQQNCDSVKHYLAKVSASTMVMMNCWRFKCMAPSKGGNKGEAALQLADSFGGGSEC